MWNEEMEVLGSEEEEPLKPRALLSISIILSACLSFHGYCDWISSAVNPSKFLALIWFCRMCSTLTWYRLAIDSWSFVFLLFLFVSIPSSLSAARSDFLDTRTVPPPLLVPDADGVLQENLEFAKFEQQDSALALWLLSSVSQAVLPHLIGMDTSAQIWNAIISFYGSKTTSRLMFYRRALHSQRKGDLSMKYFLMKIKGYCDNLASCGEAISDHEHVTAILNGLPSKYELIITIITANPVLYNAQGVTTMLLDAEVRHQVLMTEVPSSANIVTHQSADLTTSSPAYRSPSNT
ncbi:hypothetical protein PVK06_036556 [Gossypium arboreum]|uniref:Retrovirus-related Pol polyprotein from transposon TNT 1-94 n=1 Tax=Gossypium arboreum TaxID=29729 RepID=A0ABR0NK84_GOSAR|nr:hypothetical protein PVK06_036556 [Gossypium arboreum]